MADLHGTYALVYMVGMFTVFSWVVKAGVNLVLWLLKKFGGPDAEA